MRPAVCAWAVRAVAAEQHEEWMEGSRYLNADLLREQIKPMKNATWPFLLGALEWRSALGQDLLARHAGIGTAVNLAATFVALIAAIKGAATAIVALLHFAPLPYNFFLFAALLRAPQRPPLTTAVASLWLVVVLFV